MARSRYTFKMLQADIIELNKTLMSTGYYLKADQRNGYTGLDEYRVEPNGARPTCVRNIQCGTPRECSDAADAYAASPRTND